MAQPANGSAATAGAEAQQPPPPLRVWHVREPPFPGYTAPQPEGYEQSTAETAIVIDNGTSNSPARRRRRRRRRREGPR